MTSPPERLPTSSLSTLPCTVPGATRGLLPEVTSPSTDAPSFTITRPSTTAMSPSTRPVITASPWSTKMLPVTRPVTRTSPRPTATLSSTVPSMRALPSAEATRPATVSPLGTTTSPVRLMRRSGSGPSPRAAAGAAAATRMTRLSPRTASRRRRMDTLLIRTGGGSDPARDSVIMPCFRRVTAPRGLRRNGAGILSLTPRGGAVW